MKIMKIIEDIGAEFQVVEDNNKPEVQEETPGDGKDDKEEE
jgi:hypothetical protein